MEKEPNRNERRNSLWARLSKEKPVRIQDIFHVLESDFVPDFHPFRHYLDHLPPWNGDNHILSMSTTVNVKSAGCVRVRWLWMPAVKRHR